MGAQVRPRKSEEVDESHGRCSLWVISATRRLATEDGVKLIKKEGSQYELSNGRTDGIAQRMIGEQAYSNN